MGIISNIYKASYGLEAERKAKVDALDEKITDLGTAITNLDNSYNLKTKNLNADIADARISRDVNADVSSRSLAEQQQITNMQIAELEVQASQAEGSAIQNMAQTGVRQREREDGSVDNASVRNTVSSAERQIALSKAQASASMTQSYSSALSNYTSANQTIDGYKRTLAENKLNYDATRTDYTTQKTRAEKDKNYYNSAGYKFWQDVQSTVLLGESFLEIVAMFA